MRDGRSAIRGLFLKEDPERTEEVAKIEGAASEQKEQRKESGGGALNQAFNDRVIGINERYASTETWLGRIGSCRGSKFIAKSFEWVPGVRFQVSALWYETLDSKIQIASTKFFTQLNNSMNSVRLLVIKEPIFDLSPTFKQDNLTGQVNPKSQYPMTETVQTNKRERLYFLMPMASSNDLGRDQTGRWAISEAAET